MLTANNNFSASRPPLYSSVLHSTLSTSATGMSSAFSNGQATNDKDIEVLVCDDSALMRNLISNIIDKTPGMHTCGKAMNGRFCLDKIPLLNPDVIVLDIEMPVMNGVEFLKERKKQRIDIPVIILSSIATKGATVTMQCLELGACDFLTKPGGSITSDLSSVASRLVELIASYGGKYAKNKGKKITPFDTYMQTIQKVQEETQKHATLGLEKSLAIKDTEDDKVANTKVNEALSSLSWRVNTADFKLRTKKEPAVITPVREPSSIEIIAIGISTGGPNALREVFKFIDPHLKQPIVVVQHMPAGFTKEFAESLNNICPLEVKEAQEGDLVKQGRILIAPGDHHITVEKKSLATIIHLNQDPLRNGHRPSADVLFESVADQFKNHALGVIMTGMGKDGADMLCQMRKQGAWTLGQDEESSIVYGMPKVAFEEGAVQKQVPLKDMADAISSLAREHK